VINFPNGKMLGGLTTQGLHEMTLRAEFVKMNELTGTITPYSGIQMRMVVKRMVDSLEGTMVLDYNSVAFPPIVMLYEGLLKAESFILC
jgi:hypothetical protein